MKNRLKNGIALSIIPQIIVVKWLALYPELVENYYSNGFYPLWSGFFRWLFGWIPFSVGDLIYGILIIGLFYYLIKRGKSLADNWKPLLRDTVMVLAVAYFTFNLSWGLNYYRLPISETFELQEEYTTEQLYQTTEKLISKTNELQVHINSNKTSAVSIPYSQEELFTKTISGYERLAKNYPGLAYHRPSLKKSSFSTALTYMGYGGYLNPFTHESQVNSKIPNFRFPVVCGHEVGHQLGYSAENEVNFIGYLVMVTHEDRYLRFSAYAYALSYCLGEINRRNPDDYKAFLGKINPGVRANYEELRSFWKRYENPLEPVFKSIFNTFLKANSQASGIDSYNLVVSLIVGYHDKLPLLPEEEE
ncbi:MAG: DUF3810 domain-containing protein [Flavobacteriaceae bacterium]